MLRIIPRIIGPITFQQVSPIDQCWVHRRGDTQVENATRILASSTKMRKSFANFGNKPCRRLADIQGALVQPRSARQATLKPMKSCLDVRQR